MLELALNYGKGPVPLKHISSSQEISLKYIGQLMIPLKIAGLVKTIRGYHGGYYLGRSPDKIELNQIIRALEGSLNIVECINDPDICPRHPKCITRDIWVKINTIIVKYLDSITLEDMVLRYNKKVEI